MPPRSGWFAKNSEGSLGVSMTIVVRKVDYTYEKSSVHKRGMCCTDNNTRRM